MTSLTKKQNAFALAYVELGNARQAYAMAGYSQNNSLTSQQKEAHKLLHNPMVAPRIRELQAKARRRAEADYGVTVDRLTEMYMEIYESSETRPAGKLQAITSLARLHGLM
jgi:phage terminase small subunit